ncbi:uncharacterized protein Z518_01839 [Rhinocladiella mackenziei CBS 650.93]|uniref:Ribonuclease T2-like n=1 Tax=Rhinocladiella mackenziei CBS 650.93 TaxID=1442369 RepID=A0A0D2IVG1_9EURO|nr:uncharacterized protein Z518_01839 [Rhinocladiella mackenziei CBS 650.93]KIX07186.1 hypothetical protein Z518_01839 [Rhinocladiella mackenziei CBS 650.93]
MLSISQKLYQIPFLSSLLNLTPSLHHHTNHHNHCPNPPTLSCPFPLPRSIDTCCFNHPSGHFLQTQFWDTSPALGPNDSWTIHGLWPDLCTGGFDAYCDSSRSHHDIRRILHALGPELTDDLLAFMDKYWLSLYGGNVHLWTHEWNKHGTCISTLEPACYGSNSDDKSDTTNLDVLDYFVHTTSLFKTLDTYAILADAGILPSEHTTYTLRELEDAVESSTHGFPVTFRCNRFGELDEVWYHFSVMGSMRRRYGDSKTGMGADNYGSPTLNASTVREIFIPTAPDGALSNCPRRSITYRPKTSFSDPNPSPTSSSTATSTSTSALFAGKGHLEIHIVNRDDISAPSKKGCLTRMGDWYASGTCATFRAQPDVADPAHSPLFSLSSSYSPCLINPTTEKFECTKSSAVQGIFSSDAVHPSILAYQNRSTFYADHIPGRFEKVEVYANNGDGKREVELDIRWVSI